MSDTTPSSESPQSARHPEATPHGSPETAPYPVASYPPPPPAWTPTPVPSSPVPSSPAPRAAGRRRTSALVAAGALGAVVALGVGGAAGWAAGQQHAQSDLSADAAPTLPEDGTGQLPDTGTLPETQPDTQPSVPDFGDGGYGFGGDTGGSTGGSQTAATDEQEVGVLLIETTLSGGAGAGTGFVIDEDGTVVTNYHVVDGSTDIQVTVASTGETYAASVVGWNEAADIAVLELEGDPDLATIELDDDGVEVGEAVTTIGNSNGQGYLSVDSGSITGLEESITTTDELTGGGNDLTGLLVNDVYAVPGDSGGPLVDDEGEVVGVTTATTSGGATRSYAVPIEDALDIVDQIESGQETSTTRIGPGAYLGISVSTAAGQGTTGAGATVASVAEGGPAAAAGIAEGAVITAIDGERIEDVDDLTGTVSDHEPGESVTVTWIDASGAEQSATLTLGESPLA